MHHPSSRTHRRLAVALLALGALLACARETQAGTVTRVLRRCACAGPGECGGCQLPRCCTAGFCAAGDDGGTPPVPCGTMDGPRQFALAVDADGTLFVAGNLSDTVHRVTPGGCVSTAIDGTGAGGAAMSGARGLSIGADGSVYVASGAGEDDSRVFRVTHDGTRTRLADVEDPIATAVDRAGNVYVSSGGTSNTVRKLPAGGGAPVTVLDAAGAGGVPFGGPRGLAVGPNDEVYVAGEATDTVFRIAADGTKTAVLDRNAAGTDSLRQPFGVAVDAAGNLYVTGHASHSVVRLSTTGEKTSIMPPGTVTGPREIAVDAGGHVYVTGQISRNVVRLTPQGTGPYAVVTLLTVPNSPAGNRARGLAVDPAGRVFVAGQLSNDVYVWTPDGAATCGDGVVGDGEACDWGSADARCCCGVQCRLLAAGTTCDDGAFCSAGDRCDAQGACVGGGVTPCPPPDGDGNCRESCDEPSGTCTAPDPVGSACADGDSCNGADTCTAEGDCRSSGIDPCASGPECADTCDARGGGTCFTTQGTACTDDGNPCTVDQCDGQGACVSQPGNAGTPCGPAAPCRAAPVCDGAGTTCPEGAPVQGACSLPGCDPNRSVCVAGDCVCLPDLPAGCGDGVVEDAEVCGEPGLPDGPCCSGCRFAAAGTTCREAASVCDLPESCDGFSVGCPSDGIAPADTPCEDGDPCTDADLCVDGACTSTTVCDARLDRDVFARGLRSDVPVARALCRNPLPSRRRATTCAAGGFLLQPIAPRAAEPALDCLSLPPDAATPATRRLVRRFAADNAGEQEVTLPLRLNPLAIRAVKRSFRKSGLATVIVCVEFGFDDGTSIVVTRTLSLRPRLRT